MKSLLPTLSVLTLMLGSGVAVAQNSTAPMSPAPMAGDSMAAPMAGDTMSKDMTEADKMLADCLEKAKMQTDVAMRDKETATCHDAHNMAKPMGGDAMGTGGAMSSPMGGGMGTGGMGTTAK